MFLKPNQTNRVMALLTGKINPPPFLKEFREWAKSTWQVNVLDVFYDEAGLGRKRLYVILQSDEDHDRVDKAPNGQKSREEFKEAFISLCERYPNVTAYKKGDEFFVAYNNFSGELKPEVTAKARHELKALAQRPEFAQKGLWEVHESFESVHFFYQTDEQIEENERRGISDKLRSEAEKIIRKYDDFGLFSGGIPCYFSSKQTLDEKYKGSMFYYFR